MSVTFDVAQNDPGSPITVTAARATGGATITVSGWPAAWTTFPMVLTATRAGTVLAHFRVTAFAAGVLSGVTAVEGADAALQSGDQLANRPTAGNDAAIKAAINAVGPAGSSGAVQYNNGGVPGGFGSWALGNLTVPGYLSVGDGTLANLGVGLTSPENAYFSILSGAVSSIFQNIELDGYARFGTGSNHPFHVVANDVNVATFSPGGDLAVVGDVTATAFHGDGSALTGIAAGGGMAIGGTVTGGTAGRVLYVGAGPVLADSSQLTFDGVYLTMAPASGGIITPAIGIGEVTTGFSTLAAGVIVAKSLGVIKWAAAANTGGATYTQSLRLAASMMLGWTPNIHVSADDVGIVRDSAGVLRVIGDAAATSEGAIRVGAPTASTSPLTVKGAGSQTAPLLALQGISSTPQVRDLAVIDAVWADATDASRKGKLLLKVADSTGTDKTGLTIASNGTTADVAIPGSLTVAVAPLVGTHYTFVLAAGTPATTGTDKTNWLTVQQAVTIRSISICAKTAPTGAALIIDILYSTDNGATFATIWTTTANRLSLAAGTRTASTTTFNTSSLAAGALLQIDVAQVGSTVAGQDITVQIAT